MRAIVSCAVLLLTSTGCTTVAQVTSLSEPDCTRAMTSAFETIFGKQGESPAVARELAESTTASLRSRNVGPRTFVVASPSGADYGFFVQRRDEACVLRLYGRQKGFVTITDNLTYLATEPLAGCQCAE